MERYLGPCLDSLFRQGLQDSEFEVIVVNDGSIDKTSELAHGYRDKHPNVVVIDKKNAGVGAARNSGFDKAKGEIIYFLDPDDYLADGVLPLLLAKAEELNTDVLTFDTVNVYDDFQNTSSNLENPPPTPEVFDGISRVAAKKFQNEIWWFLIKREFLLKHKLRFIEGRWMEDAILAAEIFCNATRIADYPLDAHRYRILPTSAMRNRTPEHYNKIIYDNANAAEVFDGLIKELPQEHPKTPLAQKRLKTRQQSFVFFLLVRLMKSDLPLNEIKPLLKTFEPIDAYPLNKFLGPDYDGFSYRVLVSFFNSKMLITPFMRFFRLVNFNFN